MSPPFDVRDAILLICFNPPDNPESLNKGLENRADECCPAGYIEQLVIRPHVTEKGPAKFGVLAVLNRAASTCKDVGIRRIGSTRSCTYQGNL